MGEVVVYTIKGETMNFSEWLKLDEMRWQKTGAGRPPEDWPHYGVGKERADYGPPYEELEAEFGGEAPPRSKYKKWIAPEDMPAPEREEDDWEEEEEEEIRPRRRHRRWGREVVGRDVKELPWYEIDDMPEFLGSEEEEEEEIKERPPEEEDEEEMFSRSSKERRPKSDWSSNYEIRAGLKPERTWKRHRDRPWHDD